MKKFFDRFDAGRVLSEYLTQYHKKLNVIVLALPRGGVPVGYEIAKALEVPLDIFVVRKLGLPWYEELAMGAIASGGTLIFNEQVVQQANISKSEIDKVIQAEMKELNRREQAYRGNKKLPVLTDKIIILVDDGIATGATIKAAIKALRQHEPKKIVVAVPVAAKDTYEEIKGWVDDMICPYTPDNFYAVGLWYENFSQTTDEEVFKLLLGESRF